MGTLPLTVVVPTRHERANITELLQRLPAVDEIIVVDDSDDDTADIAAAVEAASPVIVIHREPEDRTGGLSTAVMTGLGTARSEFCCVMDGDLQHPPEFVEVLASRRDDGDVVIASRHNWDSINAGLSPARRAVSWALGRLALTAFRSDLHGARDPLSGFFLVRRDAIDLGRMRPNGFKVLMELLVTHPSARVSEVGFSFAMRRADASKGSPREAYRFVYHVADLKVRSVRSRQAWSMPPSAPRSAPPTVDIADPAR